MQLQFFCSIIFSITLLVNSKPSHLSKRRKSCNKTGCNKGKWILENNQEGNMIADKDSIMNLVNSSFALWVDAIESSTPSRYWRIKFLSLHGNAAVGLINKAAVMTVIAKNRRSKRGITTDSKLSKRFSREAEEISYDGDLKDGSSKILSQSFGPQITEGDTVGILVRRAGDVLLLSYDINGEAVGHDIKLQANRFKRAYPKIRFDGSGEAKISVSDATPNLQKPQKISSAFTDEWKLLLSYADSGAEEDGYGIRSSILSAVPSSSEVICKIQNYIDSTVYDFNCAYETWQYLFTIIEEEAGVKISEITSKYESTNLPRGTDFIANLNGFLLESFGNMVGLKLIGKDKILRMNTINYHLNWVRK